MMKLHKYSLEMWALSPNLSLFLTKHWDFSISYFTRPMVFEPSNEIFPMTSATVIVQYHVPYFITIGVTVRNIASLSPMPLVRRKPVGLKKKVFCNTR